MSGMLTGRYSDDASRRPYLHEVPINETEERTFDHHATLTSPSDMTVQITRLIRSKTTPYKILVWLQLAHTKYHFNSNSSNIVAALPFALPEALPHRIPDMTNTFTQYKHYGSPRCTISSLDLHLPFSPLCTSRSELLKALAGGGRIGIDAPFLPRGCDMRWFSTAEVCEVLSRFEKVIVVGDSMMRHVVGAINVLLREDLGYGAVTDWNFSEKEKEECFCNHQFDVKACSLQGIYKTTDVEKHDPESLRCGVGKVDLVIEVMLRFPLVPTELARFRELLSPTPPDSGRPYAFVFGHGLWNNLDLQATLSWLQGVSENAIQAAPYLSSPMSPQTSSRFHRLFLTPNAAGPAKPDEWIFSQGDKALQGFEDSVREEVRERYGGELETLVPFLEATYRLPFNSAVLNRFVSNEAKARWREKSRRLVRLQIYLVPFLICAWIFDLGINQVVLDRFYPTPREWSLWSVWAYHDAKALEKDPTKFFENFYIDWGKLGDIYVYLLSRLEDVKIDGAGLKEPAEGKTFISDIGRTGYDVSTKSEPWRRRYHDTLMGAAKAAERLDGWVRDRTRDICFPSDAVIGPSNPRPKPVPHGKPSAPKEEDCEPAFASPEVYYIKILTTTGFTNGQRLDAALAYADWLDFKGMTSTAADLYSWSMSIAASGLPSSPKPTSSIIDFSTGILQPGADSCVTANLLRASSALAVHKARTGDLKSALPIFLSVLRARRSLSADPNALTPPPKRDYHDVWLNWKSLVVPYPFPPAPPTGDEPPLRSLPEVCEEAGIMAYIGEILFASNSEMGLGWTRDAVEKAEQVLWLMRDNKFALGEEGERCQECVEVGIENWMSMVRAVTKEAERKRVEQEERRKVGRGWGDWIGWSGDKEQKVEEEAKKWRNEQREVELVAQRVKPLLFERVSTVNLGGLRENT
ncbi:MAG: hypothetical protein Q9227_003732 [Pyrenula ochraceoflavens]